MTRGPHGLGGVKMLASYRQAKLAEEQQIVHEPDQISENNGTKPAHDAHHKRQQRQDREPDAPDLVLRLAQFSTIVSSLDSDGLPGRWGAWHAPSLHW